MVSCTKRTVFRPFARLRVHSLWPLRMPSGVTFGLPTSLYQPVRAGMSAPKAAPAEVWGEFARTVAENARRSFLSLWPRLEEPNSCLAQLSATSPSDRSAGAARTHAGRALSSGDGSPKRFLKPGSNRYM